MVDIGLGRVTRGDADIALPKLSFELLLALIRAAPNLLTLEALMGQVWPGLVVSPETVTQRIKILRNVLGDDPKRPRYIAGLRGRGYRIVAEVTPLGEIPATQLPGRGSEPPAAAQPRRLPWRRAGIGAAAVLLAG
ncbi:MAG TPA: winged helix-turn-helix domain-containing protein, partial [Steroidobacteraceae bacterium]